MKSDSIFMGLLFLFLIGCNKDGNTDDKIHFGDVIINTQEDLESFGENEYVQIEGNLTLEGKDDNSQITDLSPLLSLESIKGGLSIEHTSITTLKGLNNLVTVGNLAFSENQKLSSLVDLKNLTSINGDFALTRNHSLTSLQGLANLSLISEGIWFQSNHGLQSLAGMEKPITITRLLLFENIALKNLAGLSNISFVENASIQITGHWEIDNLDGLKNFNKPGQFYITDNKALTNVGGFENLTNAGYVVIEDNDVLENLDGFTNLMEIDSLYLSYNPKLKDLDDFSTLSSAKVVEIEKNDELSNFCGLRPLLSSSNCLIKVEGNLYNPIRQEIIDGECNQ